MTIKREPDIFEQREWQRVMDERVRIAMADSLKIEQSEARWRMLAWVLAVFVLAGLLVPFALMLE